MANLKETMDRAVKLTVLAAKIVAVAVGRAQSHEEEQTLLGEYAAINVDFVKETAGFVSAFSGLGKNLKSIFGIFQVLGLIESFGDPYEDERVKLKAFCRDNVAKYSISLTADEKTLIGA